MAERLLYPLPEAQVLLSFGRSKLYELIAAGEIEVVKVGRRTLVPRESLERFVARLRAAASTSPVDVREYPDDVWRRR